MADHLEHLARRVEDDPLFIACPLALFAKSEGMDENALASRLCCSKENLTLVRLCRAPAADSASFHNDVETIAAKFSVDASVLAEAVRRGQAIFQMQRSATSAGTLLAARDSNKDRADTKGGAEP